MKSRRMLTIPRPFGYAQDRLRSGCRAILVVALGLMVWSASIAMGEVLEVFPEVFLADGNTPFPPNDVNWPIFTYPDIMVGTKLTIIVYSDVAEYWSGSLAIADANMDCGVLSCRDYNKITLDCAGSRYRAAGREAGVWPWEEPGINGFDLYTGSTGIEVGRWFIIDYMATEVGTCYVGFYDHSISWDDPIYYLVFSHVRNDNLVNFVDFAVFASHWQEIACNDPDWCEGADLDTDGDVDLNDLMLFTDFWLERTE